MSLAHTLRLSIFRGSPYQLLILQAMMRFMIERALLKKEDFLE